MLNRFFLNQTERKNNFHIFILEIIAVLFFVLENPGILAKNGFGFIAFISWLPVLFIVRKSSFENIWMLGGLYGLFSYGIYAFWMFNYNKVLFLIICICYSFVLAVVFLLLKITDRLFTKNYWLVQWLIICSYEYLKTLGFLGLSYGVTSYSLWRYTYLIQISSVIGVFGLNALVIFPSCAIYSIYQKFKDKTVFDLTNKGSENRDKSYIAQQLKNENKNSDFSLKTSIFFLVLWLLVFSGNILWGRLQLSRKVQYPQITVAAIQNNEHSWDGGVENYSKNIQALMKLTDEALEINPDIKIVVWPETAVVPSIMYHYNQKIDERRNKLINFVVDYMNSKKCVFVIGNGYTSAVSLQENYNSALIFVPNVNVKPPKPFVYSKIHLVPFSESFPYKDRFPGVYNQLKKYDFHHWNAGSEYKVFTMNDFSFSTPICFEDTFSDGCREMVKNGSKCFINLSNDSWSKSEVCQRQHLAMAVFRSVENKIPTVRSTTSGVTCIINQFGQIEKQAFEFTPSFVIGTVPVISQGRKLTLFTRYGDVCGKVEIILTILLLIMKLIIVTIKKVKH